MENERKTNTMENERKTNTHERDKQIYLFHKSSVMLLVMSNVDQDIAY